MRVPKILGALALLAAVGCGDPVADGAYLGEPFAQLHGRIEGDAGTSAISRPYIGVIWVDPFSYEFNAVTSVARIGDARFPGDFTVDLFDAPPERAYMRVGSARLAYGLAIVLDDVNGDGRFAIDEEIGVQAPDRMFGVAMEQALIHVANDGEPTCMQWVFGEDVPAKGFRIAEWDGCTQMFHLLPGDPALRVRLFPPAERWPDEWEEEETRTCEFFCVEEDPAPLCEMTSLQYACMEAECMEEAQAYYECTYEHCGETSDLECDRQWCGDLSLAHSLCITETCGIDAVCRMALASEG